MHRSSNRAAEPLQGRQRPFAVLDRARVTGSHGHHVLADELGWDDGQRRRPPLHDDRHQLVGAVRDPVAVEAKHLGCVLHGPEHGAGHDLRADRMQSELEVGHDAEVPTAAAHAPEQIRVLVLAGLHELAVGGDDVDGDEVVDAEPVLAHDPADATAESQPGDAGVGDDAGGDGQPEGLRLTIELAEQHSGLGARPSRFGVDPSALHGPEVDEQAVVAHRQPGEAVTTAPHSDRQLVLAPEPSCGADIGHAGAAGDQPRPTVDRAVPDLAVVVVAGIGGAQDLAPERFAQVVHCRVVDRNALGDRTHACPSLFLNRANRGTMMPVGHRRGDTRRLGVSPLRT
jgi:hypothetical protein